MASLKVDVMIMGTVFGLSRLEPLETPVFRSRRSSSSLWRVSRLLGPFGRLSSSGSSMFAFEQGITWMTAGRGASSAARWPLRRPWAPFPTRSIRTFGKMCHVRWTAWNKGLQWVICPFPILWDVFSPLNSFCSFPICHISGMEWESFEWWNFLLKL